MDEDTAASAQADAHSDAHSAARSGWPNRTLRLTVAAALVVGVGCAVLLASGRCGAVRSTSVATGPADPSPSRPRTLANTTTSPATSNSTSTSASTPPGTRTPDGAAGGSGAAAPTRTAAVPEQRRSSPPPTSPTAVASSAPISASALVQFKVTSHWGDGYRADVTVTNTGAAPLAGWHLTFQVTGATLHQPTDTGEAAMHGAVVTVTPAAWRPTLAAGAAATFGMGFDGALAAPAACLIDGARCELMYVPVADH